AFLVASSRSSTFVLASSNVTATSFFSNVISIFSTPSILLSAFLIVIGHAAQVMPGTDRVTVFVAAQAGALKATQRTMAVTSFFMTFSFSRTGAECKGRQ